VIHDHTVRKLGEVDRKVDGSGSPFRHLQREVSDPLAAAAAAAAGEQHDGEEP
jgi:hypothetical protein